MKTRPIVAAFASIAVSLGAAVVHVGAAQAQGRVWQCGMFDNLYGLPGEETYFFVREDTGFTGNEYAFIGGYWDNRVSSLWCDDGCTVTVYSDPDFGGWSRTYQGLVAAIPSPLANAISSFKMVCAAG